MKKSVKVKSHVLNSLYWHFKMVPNKKSSKAPMKDKFCLRMALLPLHTGVDKTPHVSVTVNVWLILTKCQTKKKIFK